MATLEGVRVGPLDPDRAEAFGVVDGSTSARQLIRHHLAMYPPQLVAILRLPRNDLRSDDVLVREEVEAAVEASWEGDLPDEFEVNGYAVRGDESAKQRWLTFTWAGKSGRTGKGAVPYEGDDLAESIAAGDEAVKMDAAKKAGLPWIPQATAEALTAAGRESAEPVVQLDPEAEQTKAALEEERTLRADAEARAADLQKQLDAVQADASRQSDSGVTTSPQNPEGGSPDAPPAGGDTGPALPWADYDEDNADTVAKKLRESDSVPLAEAVRAYETSPDGANRATVTRAADSILDRTPAE